MTHNVGKTDRIVRFVAGMAIVVTGLLLQSWYGLLGVILLGTSLVGYCPLYGILGIKTCRME